MSWDQLLSIIGSIINDTQELSCASCGEPISVSISGVESCSFCE